MAHRDETTKAGRIHKTVFIKASPQLVFQALTDAKDLAHWFCDKAWSDPREGGELVAQWKAGKLTQKGRAVYTRIVPDSVLELLWVDDGEGTGHATNRHICSYSIRAKRGNTEVIMLDEAIGEADEQVTELLEEGWTNVLLELRDYCERKARSVKGSPQRDTH